MSLLTTLQWDQIYDSSCTVSKIRTDGRFCHDFLESSSSRAVIKRKFFQSKVVPCKPENFLQEGVLILPPQTELHSEVFRLTNILFNLKKSTVLNKMGPTVQAPNVGSSCVHRP